MKSTWNPIRVEQILQSDQYQQEIQHDIQTAAQMDVKGVPFFVFNEKYECFLELSLPSSS